MWSTTFDGLVHCEITGHIATVTMDSPPVNALGRALLDALSHCLDALEARSDLRCLILTGTGKAFIAGGDLKEYQGITTEEFQTMAAMANRTFSRFERFPAPVIAAMNGYAFGGGLELALACDIRFAARSASMSLPEAAIGMMPSYGGTARLPKLVSPGNAKYLICSGRRLTAQEAKDMGILQEVTDQEDLMPRVRALAEEIAQKSPVAMTNIKYVLNQSPGATMEESLALEADYACRTVESRDFREGLLSFAEKRAAVFPGE